MAKVSRAFPRVTEYPGCARFRSNGAKGEVGVGLASVAATELPIAISVMLRYPSGSRPKSELRMEECL
jgi:hypothetical protein